MFLYYALKLSKKNHFHPNTNDDEIAMIDIFIIVTVVLMIFGTVFLLCLFSWQFSFTSLSNASYFQGNIANDMEKEYLLNDSPINILYQITGPDTGISVEFQSKYNNQNYDAKIYLDKNNQSMTNKSLEGKLLGMGRYSIDLNTSSMPMGIYYLRCTRQKYIKSYRLDQFSLG